MFRCASDRPTDVDQPTSGEVLSWLHSLQSLYTIVKAIFHNMSEVKYMKKIDSAGQGIRIQQGIPNEQLTFGRKHSRREKVLFAALLIVSVAASAFLFLYCLQVYYKATTDQQGGQRNPSRKSCSVCFSSGCIFSASGQFSELVPQLLLQFKATVPIRHYRLSLFCKVSKLDQNVMLGVLGSST